jgi:hypothetical protein
MPETSVNKDYFLPLREHYVRLARQVTCVEAETIAHAVQQRTHEQLWFRVRGANATHVPTALPFCEPIDHK